MVDRELSIGDYVLTGGELAALVVIDAVLRLLPGAIDEASTTEESFAAQDRQDALGHVDRDGKPNAGKLLGATGGDAGVDADDPQYTRPATFDGVSVPPVLVSGHHEQVRRWRLRESLRRTESRRPDLLVGRPPSKEEAKLIAEIRADATTAAVDPAGDDGTLDA